MMRNGFAYRVIPRFVPKQDRVLMNKIFYSLVLYVLLSLNAVVAQDQNDECMALRGTDRILCLQNFLKTLPEDAEEKSTGQRLSLEEKWDRDLKRYKKTNGEWIVGKDEFTDEVAIIGVVSNRGPLAEAMENRAPTFMIRCLNGSVSLLIDWGKRVPTLSGNLAEVRYRIDDDEQVFARWQVSNQFVTFIPGNSEYPLPEDFVTRGLLGKERLLVQMGLGSGANNVAEFNLSNLAHAVMPLRRNCRF